MTAFYPTCPTCTGALLATRPGVLDDRRIRLACADCGRLAPPRAWRRWLQA